MTLWGLNKIIHLICFVNRKCNLFSKCNQVMLILLPDLVSSGEAGYSNGSHAWLGFTLLDSNLALLLYSPCKPGQIYGSQTCIIKELE